MNLRHYTIVLLIVATFLVAGYDTYCRSKGEENTITDVLRDGSKLNAILPVIGGILAGHLFGEFLIEFASGLFIGVLFWNPLGESLRGRWSK